MGMDDEHFQNTSMLMIVAHLSIKQCFVHGASVGKSYLMRIWLTQNELWKEEKNTEEILRKDWTKEHTYLREKEEKEKERIKQRMNERTNLK